MVLRCLMDLTATCLSPYFRHRCGETHTWFRPSVGHTCRERRGSRGLVKDKDDSCAMQLGLRESL